VTGDPPGRVTPVLHVALLRGINVGGNRKVEMPRLRATVERAGATDVTTYINTGNVLFRDGRADGELVTVLEDAIEGEFGFRVPVLVRPAETITAVAAEIPDDWTNDATMKCDVLFLWDGLDHPEILDELPVRPEIEDVVYVPGAVVWRVDRDDVTRSGLMRIAGTDLYKGVTIRNVNTVRKLADLVQIYEE
jgi:uncharacterized protein (DUF1697 family)